MSRSAYLLFSLRMERFEPIWSLVVECTVRTLGVVEINVISNAFRKLPLRMVLSPIDLLPFHGGKEGLGHSIVMRTARLRERCSCEAVSEKRWMYIASPGHCETSAAGAHFYSDMPAERWK